MANGSDYSWLELCKSMEFNGNMGGIENMRQVDPKGKCWLMVGDDRWIGFKFHKNIDKDKRQKASYCLLLKLDLASMPPSKPRSGTSPASKADPKGNGTAPSRGMEGEDEDAR